MSKHIGIVGCSSEGAALCYRTVCLEGIKALGANQHPEVSMHTHSFAKYVQYLETGDWAGVGELMLSSAEKLVSIGAEVLICPDNTIHQAFSFVEQRSPAPWIHIAEVVAAEANAHGFRNLGLTGTKWLVRSEVYPEKLAAFGLEYTRPEPDEIDGVNRIIMDELVNGVHSAESIAYLQSVIEKLAAKGCDAVVLGCTELPIVLSDSNSGLPTLDSTRLLAKTAVHYSVGF